MRRIAWAAMAAGLLAAGSASAQEPIEIRVVAAGMSIAGVEVFVMVGGEPWRLGETDGDGRVTAPQDLVGLRPGDPVEVHQVACTSGRALLLSPPDESPGAVCEERRRTDPTCSCTPLGVTGWGSDMQVDLVPETTPRVAREPGDGPAWVVAAGAGFSSWPNLDKGCAASPTALACGLDAEGPTFRGAVEMRPFRDRPFSLMGAVGYTPGLVVEHAFAESQNPLDVQHNVAELDVLTFEGYAVGRLPATEALDFFVALGFVWAYDRVQSRTTFGDPALTATEDRADSGGRLGGRAGVDWWSAGGSWGARVEVGGMTGNEENIDAGWSAAGMVLVPLGGR